MNRIEKLCRRYLVKRGFAVSATTVEEFDGDYALAKGQSYEHYVATQIAGNHKKLDRVWADKDTIDLICDYLISSGSPLNAGLCHGSRNGAEVRWFQERLGVPVVGTDISDTAEKFGLVQWDFHEPNPDWTGKFDFIYTNSHDHAINPEKAFRTWVDQLTPTGRLIVEHSEQAGYGGVTELDPFGVPPRQFPYVMLKFGRGEFATVDMILPAHNKTIALPNLKTEELKIWLFIIRKNAAQ